MALPISEQVIAAVYTALQGITAIEDLTVMRNDDVEYETGSMPIVNQLDADSDETVIDRSLGAVTWELEITVEGAVTGPNATIGTDARILAAEIKRAIMMAEPSMRESIPGFQQTLASDGESILERTEEGTAAHVVFGQAFAFRYQTSDIDPYSPPA